MHLVLPVARVRAALRLASPNLRPVDDGGSPGWPDLEERIVAVGLALTLFGVIGQTTVHLVNLELFDLRYDLLNADQDGSVFSWASAAVTFVAAAFAALLAGLRPAHARMLLALAAALAFLSLDDTIQIHERVSGLRTELGPIEHFSRLFWPLVYMPLLTLVFLGLAILSAGMRLRPAKLLLVGLGLLAGAIFFEMTSPALFAVGLDHGDLGYEVHAAAEEGAELGGWMLVALALGVTVYSAGAPLPAPPDQKSNLGIERFEGGGAPQPHAPKADARL